MPLFPRATKNPEEVALGVLALRTYAQGTPPATSLESGIGQILANSGVSQALAQRLVANFDKVSANTRLRMLGSLGASNAQVPANIQRGQRPFSRPGAIAATLPISRPSHIFGDGGIAVVPGQQILAPERYGINYHGLYCVDETGNDNLGSDEIYVFTSAVHITPQGENVVDTIRHPFDGTNSSTYGDVDSYNARIGPVASCWSALVADTVQGMSLTTVVMEHDEGDPDAYREEVDTAVKLGIAIATYLYPPGGALLALIEASGLITDFFNWLLGTGDEEVGTTTVVIDLAQLENYSRTRATRLFVNRVVVSGSLPQPTTESVDTGLLNHFVASVNDNDYYVGYQVVRQPRAPLFENIVE